MFEIMATLSVILLQDQIEQIPSPGWPVILKFSADAFLNLEKPLGQEAVDQEEREGMH